MAAAAGAVAIAAGGGGEVVDDDDVVVVVVPVDCPPSKGSLAATNCFQSMPGQDCPVIPRAPVPVTCPVLGAVHQQLVARAPIARESWTRVAPGPGVFDGAASVS